MDGHPLSTLSTLSYRRQMAVVLQEDFLFSGTVAENIQYGHPHASFKEMENSAKLAQAHSFISQLDQQYQSQIGEQATRLSSGQKQRIAIARALLRKPRMLILDEATSALDASTENEVQESIARFMKEKTTLLIAHRFSSLMHADRIIVLDQGRVAQIGDHASLVKQEGYYSSLYAEQFK